MAEADTGDVTEAGGGEARDGAEAEGGAEEGGGIGTSLLKSDVMVIGMIGSVLLLFVLYIPYCRLDGVFR